MIGPRWPERECFHNTVVPGVTLVDWETGCVVRNTPARCMDCWAFFPNEIGTE